MKTIPLILQEAIVFLQIPVDVFYDDHKTSKIIKGVFAQVEANDPPEENPLKELPLIDLEHEDFITSIASPQ